MRERERESAAKDVRNIGESWQPAVAAIVALKREK
jgi:hypothetical protein